MKDAAETSGTSPTRRYKYHGMSRTPEYGVYKSAKSRCTNPKDQRWENYGARGIKFLFISFEQFFSELGPRPKGKSVDRINTNGHYEPGNVRWATRVEQANNKRYQHNSLKTECPKGHPYDEQNTRIDRDGKRRCKECHRQESFRQRHTRAA